MRQFVKRVLRPLLRVPLVGRALRALVAIWRAPVAQVRVEQNETAVHELAVQLHALQVRVDESRQATEGGLDSLFRVVTEVSDRQHTMDADRDNLARSVPVALRRLRRAEEDVERRLSRSAEEVSSLRDELAATQAKLAEATGNVGWLLDRVEFIRSELLFEFRYHDPDRAADAPETKINVAPDALGTGARVNLGSGHRPLEGFVNVDNRDLPGVDVVCDVTSLPFEDGTVSEFFSSHFLEHFPQEKLVRVLLPYLHDKLAPGGRLRAVVPDADAMMRAYVAGTYPYGDLREVVYGGQDYDGDFHFNMFTTTSLASILTRAGFVNVRTLAEARVNGKSLELEIEAFRA